MIDMPSLPAADSGRLELLRREAADFAGLDLAALSAGTREEKVRRIAAQFEEMLVNTLIQTMDGGEKKSDTAESAGMGSLSSLRRMFLSQFVAGSGGFGYAEVIRSQIEQKLQPQTAPDGAAATLPFHLAPQQMVPPLAGAVTSPFGWRADPLDGVRRFHAGVDLRAPIGSPVVAFLDGTVQFSGWRDGYGQVVEIAHDNGLVSRYAHNSQLLAEPGRRVAAGTAIALSGSSGRSTGPHLHFEILRDGQALDAQAILAAISPNVRAKPADLQDVMA